MSGSEPITLLLDFDGTLFQLPVDHAGLRRELGLAPGARLGELLQRFLDEGNTAGLATVTRYELAAARVGSLRRGAEECLRSAANVAIVTRNSRAAVRVALGAMADGIFVVGREDVRRLKPDPEGVRVALAHFGVGPVEAVLVGDTHHDVAAARAAGTHSVVVRNPLLAYAPPGADRYLDDLTGILSGPRTGKGT